MRQSFMSPVTEYMRYTFSPMNPCCTTSLSISSSESEGVVKRFRRESGSDCVSRRMNSLCAVTSVPVAGLPSIRKCDSRPGKMRSCHCLAVSKSVSG